MEKEILENDKLEEQGNDYAIYSQPYQENVISYKIDGLYKPNSKEIFSRKELLENPPILELQDLDGEKVSFLLTKELTNELVEKLKILRNGYYGISNVKKMTLKEFLNFEESLGNLSINTVILLSGMLMLILISIFK